jgi:uncharacterized repeat protein (TIGR01451 family)
MRISLLLPLFIFLFFIPTLLPAQGWEKKFGTSINYEGYYALPTIDGGYIFTASSENSIYAFYHDMRIIKTNANGDTLWTKYFDDVTMYVGRNIQQTSDGGYIIIARVKSGGGLIHLTKLSGNGSIEWRKTVASPWTGVNLCCYTPHSIQQTTDGGYIIAGQLTYVGLGTSDAVIIKTNANGEMVWGRAWQIAYLRGNVANTVEQTPDGGYILTGSSESGGFIIKTDANGYKTWEKDLFEFSFEDIKLANNEPGYVLIGRRAASFSNGRSGAYFVKINNNGDTLFTKFMGGWDSVTLNSINKTNDGGYCIAGYPGITNTSNDVLLIKTNNNGDTAWTRRYGDAYNDIGYSALQTNDGNYILAGTTTGSNSKTQAYLIRTDKLGNVLTNVITGNIFEEKNNNCLPDAGEKKLNNPAYWKVKVMPGDKYAVPDAAGNYIVKVDTGSYQLNAINTHPFWDINCPVNTQTVTFNKFYDTVSNKNFGLKTTISCPLMWVDVAGSILRTCRETVYTIRYCNNGTIDAADAYIEFTLDAALSFKQSTIAPTSQNNNVLRFDLGTVKAGDCGTIYVTTNVSCTAAINSSVCVTAKIYPNTTCTPPPTGWDKSSISVTGKCIGNGVVRFIILNTGSDMQGPSQYRIYVNNAIVQTNNFQLTAGDSLVIQINACGNTVRLEADQRPGHPGKSHPRATVEGCAGCASTPNFGSRTAAAPDDADVFIEEDCGIIRNSLDPNDKSVIPAGITSNHYVSSKDELEYRINFQNTGNDTAFKVVLIDTLDLNVLDISSFFPGVASHPYTFKITGKGVLEWTFDNILLPDSTTNEKASHGFVKFKINQLAGLANGTTIKNKAGIYFDFNPPVNTNRVDVTVNDFVPQDTKDYNIVIIKNTVNTTATEITIVPNPLVTSSIIKIQSPEVTASDVLLLNIFDATGRKVNTISFTNREVELKKRSMSTGVYFLEIIKGSKKLANGKLLVR